MSTGTHTAGTTDERDRKRRGVVFLKFGLAGAALLGIAAAATSAAWSDDAWFKADATAFGTVDLKASNDNVTFVDAPVVGNAVTIGVDPAFFAHLDQGADRTTTIYLQNAGTAKLALTATAPSLSGTVFQGTKPATVAVDAVPATIDPGAVVPITVELTTDANWPTTYQGASGTIQLHYTAVATS